MALRGIHATVGGVAGVAVYGCYKRQKKEEWTLLGVAGSAALGVIFALLPDIIESAAKNPHHRQFFHSFVVLIAAIMAYNKIGKDDLQKLMFNTGISGYASHLVLDALTPQGLPLI